MLGKTRAVIIIGGLVTGCVSRAAWAQPEIPKPVFACSLGHRSVSVTAVGQQLIYKFGTTTNIELSIIGSASRRNVLYREDRYAGMEYQLRFVRGTYSYIVYSMEGNSQMGAAAVSGLTVMNGTKVISDMSCRHYTEISVGFDFRLLPQDTEDYSAM